MRSVKKKILRWWQYWDDFPRIHKTGWVLIPHEKNTEPFPRKSSVPNMDWVFDKTKEVWNTDCFQYKLVRFLKSVFKK